MLTRDFDYLLPNHLIARHPPKRRGDSRLLLLNPPDDKLWDQRFSHLPKQLCKGDLLILNNTRVLPARLHACKSTGGRVEILMERLHDERTMIAQFRARRGLAVGCRLTLGKHEVLVSGHEGTMAQLQCAQSTTWIDLLQRYGQMPLPPYIKRPAQASDTRRYQTIYAQEPGSVAAPTAGLHFTTPLLRRCREAGAAIAYLTLHIGAGTFQPVRTVNAEEHTLHAEFAVVPDEVCRLMQETRRNGGRIIAVGTTTVRALETACAGGAPRAWSGDTRLFIRPGYRFKAVDALLTNFHLPRSSLLMLVCAFAGHKRVLAAYRHAIQNDYRFYSYGDAMFISQRGHE